MSLLADELIDLVVEIAEAVFAEAGVLNLHHLTADLAKDLLSPLVRLIEIAALAREVRAALLLAVKRALLAGDELVEHVLGEEGRGREGVSSGGTGAGARGRESARKEREAKCRPKNLNARARATLGAEGDGGSARTFDFSSLRAISALRRAARASPRRFARGKECGEPPAPARQNRVVGASEAGRITAALARARKRRSRQRR